MRNYSDPTANAAIGTVNKEFEAKKKLANSLKLLRRYGLLSRKTADKASVHFTGIYQPLFENIFK